MHRNRTVIISITAAVILGIAAFLLLRPAEPPSTDDQPVPAASDAGHDLYNPARTALINARQHLSESFSQEQDILEQVQRVHQELDESLTLLARAEQIDPKVKVEVDALRARLAALEDQRSLGRMDEQALRDTYEALLRDFEDLIQRY